MVAEVSGRFVWVLASAVVLGTGCGSDERVLPPDDDASFVPRPVGNQAGERRFVEVASAGQVPGVALQPTARGRSIGTLHAFGSRVHLGYGDYTENTGPITSVAYSVLREEFDVGQTLSSEEVLEFLTHDGFLFAADLDPRGHEALGSVFRLASWTTGWQAMPPIEGAVHTFAMAEYQGRLFTGVGSVVSEPARIVSTEDHGSTWQTEHETESPADGFSRYTHLAATDDELFVSGRVYSETSVAFAVVHENDAWSPVLDVPNDGFLIPLALGDEIAVLQFSDDRGKGGVHFATFEVKSAALVPSDDALPTGASVINWNVEQRVDDGDRVWLLSMNEEGRYLVHSGERLGAWTQIVELPELQDDGFTALAYLDNTLYLASAGGGLFALRGVYELF